MHGGAADRSGLIHVGDEVCEVNGISVEGKTPNCVLKILVSRSFYIIFIYYISYISYIFSYIIFIAYNFLNVNYSLCKTIYILFQQNSEGTITFKIVPADSKGGIRESKVFHFD